MGKGRICIWIIRPVVTAPAFLPLQRCPGDQSADLITKMELFGGDSKGLYMLNSELKARGYTAPSLVL